MSRPAMPVVVTRLPGRAVQQRDPGARPGRVARLDLVEEAIVSAAVHDVGERAGQLEPLGTALELAPQRLPSGLVDPECVAALTGVCTALIARIGGFKLAIGGQQLPFDQAKGVQELHHDSHGLVDHVVTDAVAEVTEVPLAWDTVMETS